MIKYVNVMIDNVDMYGGDIFAGIYRRKPEGVYALAPHEIDNILQTAIN